MKITLKQPRAIVVEIKDVIITSDYNGIPLPVNTFKSILCCGATATYQSGGMTEAEYFSLLAKDFEIDRKDVVSSFDILKRSLRPNISVVSYLQQMKTDFPDQVKVYAMGNLSLEEYALARKLPISWNIFDGIFTSGETGMRKPELRFFNHVLGELNLRPEQVVFVDYDTDNVLTALAMGMQGVLLGLGSVSHQLRNLVDVDAVGRGRRFLANNAGTMHSITTTGVEIRENFAQLLILEASGDPSLVDIEPHETTWNYFIGKPVLTQTSFPDDADTTSLGITILNRPAAAANVAMDKMLRYRSKDNLITTFFTDFKQRVDPVVCCNVLSLFHKYNRGHEIPETLDWVCHVLERRAYIYGTSFYPMPEAFLFFCHRMISHLTWRTELHHELKSTLRERLMERIGVPVDSISLAMRLITCRAVGLRDAQGLKTLLQMQSEEGDWGLGTVYHYASKRLAIGNRGLSTALAIQAIERCQHWL
ncbi:HAD-like protein [Aspergillus varians]